MLDLQNRPGDALLFHFGKHPSHADGSFADDRLRVLRRGFRRRFLDVDEREPVRQPPHLRNGALARNVRPKHIKLCLNSRVGGEFAEPVLAAFVFVRVVMIAEYDAAREEQRAVEGEISELDYKVKNAVIIEENADDSYVHIGCTVKVYDSMFDEECEYEITGSMESDPVAGKISNESPAGAALMRHKRGDVVEVNAPDGLYTLKILDIRVN